VRGRDRPAGALAGAAGAVGAARGLGVGDGAGAGGGAGITYAGGVSSGTDISAAADNTHTGAVATGTGAGGSIRFQTSFNTNVSGTTAQGLFDKFVVAAKTLYLSTTSATTTTFCVMSVAVANSAVGCTVAYTIEAIAGTTQCNTESGMVTFVGKNINGTATTNATSTSFGTTQSVSTGTLTITWGATVTGTNINLRVTPTWTVITPTIVRISYTVISNGQTAITPQ